MRPRGGRIAVGHTDMVERRKGTAWFNGTTRLRPRGIRTADLPYYRGRPDAGFMSGGFGISRDSDALERSNYAAAWSAYRRAGVNVRADGFNHWAVGWIDEMIVPISRAAVEVLAELRGRLESYPVLDDEDYSQREWDDNHPSDSECYAGEDCYCAVAESREDDGAA